jgi:23S rRNA (adenine2503-C2)-methyltransferase
MILDTKIDFFSLTFDQLKAHIAKIGKEKFRAQQLYKWVYEKNIFDIDQMTNLSKDFREMLKESMTFDLPKMVDKKISSDGTRKYLFDIGAGLTVETVMIPSDERKTLCLSSEVGCNMACTFCFTGKQKLKRRLTAGEIVGQYMQIRLDMGEERISNLVFMGMGEPLDNTEAVFDSIDIFKSDYGINLSRKKITVSTSGLVPQIPLITASGTRLAVSLNAPNDEIRNKIMPINKKYPLNELLKACKVHAHDAKDRITFEYVLLNGVTDDFDHAKQVAVLLENIPCKINLIPFNEHPDSEFKRSERSRVFHFQRYLLDKGFNVTIRRTMGRDIFAACGQLTSLYKGRPDKQDVTTGVLG